MNAEMREALKRLPAVDEALRAFDGDSAPRWAMLQAVREQIALLRQAILDGRGTATEVDPQAVRRRAAELLRPSLRPVLNATGVVLHTNLGRAPLGETALARILEVARGYSNLEYALDRRGRGSRHVHAAEILRGLTGAEDAVVVNNNAAAVLLALSALARGREVVVSRGELIEIGGSFRLPDVMAASGAILREVGTTNRTHARDYRAAITEQTGLLLKAHRSNFAVVGFVAEVPPEELVGLGRERGVPTLFDLGSGSLVDLAALGLPGEVTVQQAVAQGFDLVTFSGDKLLGGPQAGVIVGRRALVEQVRSHPLMRAVRPDKLTLAGLVATLEAYRDGAALEALPALAMLATPLPALKRRAAKLRSLLGRTLHDPWALRLVSVDGRVGGGAAPAGGLPSWAVAVTHPALGADELEARLRAGDPPVIARIEEDRLLFDVRTVPDAELKRLAGAAALALGGAPARPTSPGT